ncbi:hypothetical protein AB7C87_00840 [Natrarchaeobius sp. A-rgal3]|uniref:hypothetical protein n=1 Tax=Natrarchaeobius versutus TaxID=1679078 RepID=UPI00350FE170
MVDLDLNIVIGHVSHIRARSSGGPRYDPEMDDSERDKYSNLIILCPTHHEIVDKAPEEYPPEVLEQWKLGHEQQSPDVPELSRDLLEELFDKVEPTMLLIHVQEDDIDALRDILDWVPREEYPEYKDHHDSYPVVVTFDDLQELLSRAAVPYRQKRNGKPFYKQTGKWKEEEIIQALSIVAQMMDSAIQYYRVEGSRRKSKIRDDL